MAIIKNPPMLAVGADGKKWDGEEVLNGVIEEYLATADAIGADTFVEFVNTNGDMLEKGADTSINTGERSGFAISAVALDEYRVLVLHSLTVSYKLYAVVCTIRGTAITKGADTLLPGGAVASSNSMLSAVALGDGGVFITYAGSDGLYAGICSINGSTITGPQSATLISMDNNLCEIAPAVLVDDNKVFVLYSYGNNNGRPRYSVICSIGESGITLGTRSADMRGDSSGTGPVYDGTTMSAIALSANRVLIVFSLRSSTDTNYYLYGRVCTINGTTISLGTRRTLEQTSELASRIESAMLTSDKVFLSYIVSSHLYGAICSISDTSLTKSASVQLDGGSSSSHKEALVVLDEKRIFVAHARYLSSQHQLYGVVCLIDGNTITPNPAILLSTATNSGSFMDATLLGSNRIFITHSYGTSFYLYGIVVVFSPTKGVAIATSNIFDGLTKTECTTTAPGEVWVWDNPYVPTLQNLKRALDNGNAEELFPPGTEIPDYHDGVYTPLIVGHYEQKDGIDRVGLVRAYQYLTAQKFGSNTDYPTSDVFSFLNSTYADKCSDALKLLIAETEVPWYDGGKIIMVPGKWHLLSTTEVMGVNTVAEGVGWSYWRQQIGSMTPTNNANAGRITYRDGAAQGWWLRSIKQAGYPAYIGNSGAINASNYAPSTAFGVIPICYITGA